MFLALLLCSIGLVSAQPFLQLTDVVEGVNTFAFTDSTERVDVGPYLRANDTIAGVNVTVCFSSDEVTNTLISTGDQSYGISWYISTCSVHDVPILIEPFDSSDVPRWFDSDFDNEPFCQSQILDLCDLMEKCGVWVSFEPYFNPEAVTATVRFEPYEYSELQDLDDFQKDSGQDSWTIDLDESIQRFTWTPPDDTRHVFLTIANSSDAPLPSRARVQYHWGTSECEIWRTFDEEGSMRADECETAGPMLLYVRGQGLGDSNATVTFFMYTDHEDDEEVAIDSDSDEVTTTEVYNGEYHHYTVTWDDELLPCQAVYACVTQLSGQPAQYNHRVAYRRDSDLCASYNQEDDADCTVVSGCNLAGLRKARFSVGSWDGDEPIDTQFEVGVTFSIHDDCQAYNGGELELDTPVNISMKGDEVQIWEVPYVSGNVTSLRVTLRDFDDSLYFRITYNETVTEACGDIITEFCQYNFFEEAFCQFDLALCVAYGDDVEGLLSFYIENYGDRNEFQMSLSEVVNDDIQGIVIPSSGEYSGEHVVPWRQNFERFVPTLWLEFSLPLGTHDVSLTTNLSWITTNFNLDYEIGIPDPGSCTYGLDQYDYDLVDCNGGNECVFCNAPKGLVAFYNDNNQEEPFYVQINITVTERMSDITYTEISINDTVTLPADEIVYFRYTGSFERVEFLIVDADATSNATTTFSSFAYGYESGCGDTYDGFCTDEYDTYLSNGTLFQLRSCYGAELQVQLLEVEYVQTCVEATAAIAPTCFDYFANGTFIVDPRPMDPDDPDLDQLYVDWYDELFVFHMNNVSEAYGLTSGECRDALYRQMCEEWYTRCDDIYYGACRMPCLDALSECDFPADNEWICGGVSLCDLECIVDDDCFRNEVCQGNVCGCARDADCLSGSSFYTCEEASGHCVPKCNEAHVDPCPYCNQTTENACVDEVCECSCTTDEDCQYSYYYSWGDDYACVDSVCKYVRDCETSDECFGDSTCEGEQCTAPAATPTKKKGKKNDVSALAPLVALLASLF